MTEYPNILTIAGSDSGGGAGIQADVKTMTVLHAFGMSVITALTAQNGEGVSGIHAVPPDFVAEQYRMVTSGFKVSAAKLGMLANSAIMEALAPLLAKRDFPLVIDPVCVSQSGHALMEADAIGTLRDKIVPLADLLTPNIPEAEALTGLIIKDSNGVREAMEKLHGMGAKNVLIKGGHMDEREAAPGDDPSGKGAMTDWLGLEDGRLLALSHPRVTTPNNHGTGCTLSAAIATFFGFGNDVEKSVRLAQEFLVRALANSFTPGKGAGPVNFYAGANLKAGSDT